eukprot:403346221
MISIYFILLRFIFHRDISIYSDIFTILVFIHLYALLEKSFKDQWVLRDSFQKSYRTLSQLIDQEKTIKLVISKNGQVMFMNQKGLDFIQAQDVSSNNIFESMPQLLKIQEKFEETQGNMSLENLTVNYQNQIYQIIDVNQVHYKNQKCLQFQLSDKTSQITMKNREDQEMRLITEKIQNLQHKLHTQTIVKKQKQDNHLLQIQLQNIVYDLQAYQQHMNNQVSEKTLTNSKVKNENFQLKETLQSIIDGLYQEKVSKDTDLTLKIGKFQNEVNENYQKFKFMLYGMLECFLTPSNGVPYGSIEHSHMLETSRKQTINITLDQVQTEVHSELILEKELPLDQVHKIPSIRPLGKQNSLSNLQVPSNIPVIRSQPYLQINQNLDSKEIQLKLTLDQSKLDDTQYRMIEKLFQSQNSLWSSQEKQESLKFLNALQCLNDFQGYIQFNHEKSLISVYFTLKQNDLAKKMVYDTTFSNIKNLTQNMREEVSKHEFRWSHQSRKNYLSSQKGLGEAEREELNPFYKQTRSVETLMYQEMIWTLDCNNIGIEGNPQDMLNDESPQLREEKMDTIKIHNKWLKMSSSPYSHGSTPLSTPGSKYNALRSIQLKKFMSARVLSEQQQSKLKVLLIEDHSHHTQHQHNLNEHRHLVGGNEQQSNDQSPHKIQRTKELLNQLGISHITEAQTAREGMQLFKEAVQQGKCYDIVIVDLILPEIDGYEVTNGLRDYEQNNNQPLASKVFICGTTSSKQLPNVMPPGFDIILQKPINSHSIKNIMQIVYKKQIE